MEKMEKENCWTTSLVVSIGISCLAIGISIATLISKLSN